MVAGRNERKAAGWVCFEFLSGVPNAVEKVKDIRENVIKKQDSLESKNKGLIFRGGKILRVGTCTERTDPETER